MGWQIELSGAAQQDFDDIIDWTAEHLGERQAGDYAEVLIAAIRELGAGPRPPGGRARDELGDGIWSLHVARRGRRGRHLLMFRVSPAASNVIEVLRILHDAMDLQRHLPARD